MQINIISKVLSLYLEKNDWFIANVKQLWFTNYRKTSLKTQFPTRLVSNFFNKVADHNNAFGKIYAHEMYYYFSKPGQGRSWSKVSFRWRCFRNISTNLKSFPIYVIGSTIRWLKPYRKNQQMTLPCHDMLNND